MMSFSPLFLVREVRLAGYQLAICAKLLTAQFRLENSVDEIRPETEV
jgi:hypothetical protein